MIQVVMLRHSKTVGNTKKRYIGTTDEPLCQEGIDLLMERAYPQVDCVYTSPLKRCRQTASIIYPGREQNLVPELRECDFGEFENKNYLELADNPHYQEWIDSNATLPFPGGESREAFQTRSIRAFHGLIDQCIQKEEHNLALIIHGGTICSIMSQFAVEKKDFYQWNPENGSGYLLMIDQKLWKDQMKIKKYIKI